MNDLSIRWRSECRETFISLSAHIQRRATQPSTGGSASRELLQIFRHRPKYMTSGAWNMLHLKFRAKFCPFFLTLHAASQEIKMLNQ